jgi:hypothetical protein
MSLLDRSEIDRLILDSVQQANVLPLTSGCDSHCVFCSHKNNPPGIAVVSIGRRSLAEITRSLAFLDPAHVITIGESATPIIEGEPLSHPDFAEIIELLRRAFPGTPVEITTNGRYLTPEVVALLEKAGGITLNVSLNSASPRGRRLLMADTPQQSERAIAAVRLLATSAVPFSGSLVAMPNLVGWDDLRETVRFLAASGATVVRVIVPAYAEQADRALFPDEATVFAEVRRFVAEMAAGSRCPVLIEPSCPGDLAPVVSGVLEGSPAWQAGLRAVDVFTDISGRTPRSRVDAWKALLPAGPVRARVARGDVALDISWVTSTEGASGVTLEYDFDPERAEAVRRAVAARDGLSLLLASELGHAVVRAVLDALGLDETRAAVLAVKNLTFGGTIRAAGLLTVDDYLAAYSGWRQTHSGAVSQILVPRESFNSLSLDLKHVHSSTLERQTGVPVTLA